MRFREAWPDSDIFPYIGWFTPIDRTSGASGVYATHFTWYEGIRSIYNGLTGNMAHEFSEYILRQHAADNPAFVPTTISTSATWNTNSTDGTAGTPASGFVYHWDPAGTQPMTPPARTIWWVTNNTAALSADALAATNRVPFPLLASSHPVGMGNPALGTYENDLFGLQVPIGWRVQHTISRDQFVFTSDQEDAPVIRVFILPAIENAREENQFEPRWQFRGRTISRGTGPENMPMYRAEGRDSFFSNHWSMAAAAETRDGFVIILHVTVPEAQVAQWQPMVRRIVHSFEPSPGVYK